METWMLKCILLFFKWTERSHYAADKSTDCTNTPQTCFHQAVLPMNNRWFRPEHATLLPSHNRTCQWLFTVTFVHTSLYHLLGWKQLSGLRSRDDSVWEWLRPRGAEHLPPPPLCFCMLKLFEKSCNANAVLYLYRPATKLCHTESFPVKALILSEEIWRWGEAGKQSIMWRSNANERSICYVWLPPKAK